MDYDQLALDYARHRQVQPEVLKSLLRSVTSERSLRLLEVGSGTGNYIIALSDLTRHPCWGVEPSAQMLARARERRQQQSAD